MKKCLTGNSHNKIEFANDYILSIFAEIHFMNIKTLFFGMVKDITKSNSVNIEVDGDITVEQFVVLLQEKFVGFPKFDTFSVAVNEAYAEKDFVIKANNIVAIIPPVSGG